MAAQEKRLQAMLEGNPTIGAGLRKVSMKGNPKDLAVGAKQPSVEIRKKAVQTLTSQLADAFAKKNLDKKKKTNPGSDDDEESSDYTSSEYESSDEDA